MKLPELTIGRFKARIPIVQGGMSVRVSTSSLAAAVADCGGIGTIGGSGIPIDELQEDIRKAKRMTSGIVAVNIMFAVKQFMEVVKASIEAGVDMIVTGAGFSRDIFKVGKDHNVPIVSIVSSRSSASSPSEAARTRSSWRRRRRAGTWEPTGRFGNCSPRFARW